jgi:hypothetical protein
MAKATQERPGFRETMKRLPLVFKFTAKRDKWFVPLTISAVVLAIAITVALWFAVEWFAIPFGLMLVLLAVLIVLNLRANRAFMIEAEGQPGAAAGIVENMRGDFRVTPALASTTQMDFVHLVVCRAGVVLLGEGNPSRVRNLIGQERKRLQKVIGSADLRDYVLKLPRTLGPKEVAAIDKRIKALTARPQLPKGAIPKNLRPPKGAFRAMRGGPR